MINIKSLLTTAPTVDLVAAFPYIDKSSLKMTFHAVYPPTTEQESTKGAIKPSNPAPAIPPIKEVETLLLPILVT